MRWIEILSSIAEKIIATGWIGIVSYITTLVLSGVVGWGISALLALPGKAARERDAEAKAYAIGMKVQEDFYLLKHPGETRESISPEVRNDFMATTSAAMLYFRENSPETFAPLAGTMYATMALDEKGVGTVIKTLPPKDEPQKK